MSKRRRRPRAFRPKPERPGMALCLTVLTMLTIITIGILATLRYLP